MVKALFDGLEGIFKIREEHFQKIEVTFFKIWVGFLMITITLFIIKGLFDDFGRGFFRSPSKFDRTLIFLVKLFILRFRSIAPFNYQDLDLYNPIFTFWSSIFYFFGLPKSTLSLF